MDYTMERLFNHKHSERPLWLCILLFVLITSLSFLILTDLAGCLDFVFQSEPIEVEELSITGFEDTFISSTLPIIEKRAERGMFSYYMEAYPIVLSIEIINKVEDTMSHLNEYVAGKNELNTKEEKDEYTKENIESIESMKSNLKEYKGTLKDRLILSTILTAMYHLISFLLFTLCVWKLHSGLSVKILYKIHTRDVRWIM